MFSLRLKQLREAAGFKSQQAFANAFGVAQSTVGGWETGAREPNQETTIRLAQFFGVSVDCLLGYEPENPSDVNIKDALKYFREQKNITQAELAEKVGISKDIVGMYERGEYIPDYKTLETIANVLDVRIDALFDGNYDLLIRALTAYHNAVGIGLTDREMKILYAYRRASFADKQIIDNIADRYPSYDSALTDNIDAIVSKMPESQTTEQAEANIATLFNHARSVGEKLANLKAMESLSTPSYAHSDEEPDKK